MYRCFPGCGSFFDSTSSKQKHEKLHCREKPYRCDYLGCRKSFARFVMIIFLIHVNRRYDLKAHTRSHTKEKPYSCTILDCGKKFSRNSSLREHERNIHGLYLTQKTRNSIKTTFQPNSHNAYMKSCWMLHNRNEQFIECKDTQKSDEIERLDDQTRVQTRKLINLFWHYKEKNHCLNEAINCTQFL
jgi:uncharacterized Zn-finger protein